MCKICDEKLLAARRKAEAAKTGPSRRDVLAASALGLTALSTGLFSGSGAHAQPVSGPPVGSGEPGRQILLKGGIVLSIDNDVGNFPVGDVLVEGSRIVDISAVIDAPEAEVIDASGKIVMPGFVDTHHHQFETALRSQLADGILFNDGRPANAEANYYETILLNFSSHYRPEDVYISELFGGLSQLDAGVTTVLDISQIHHSPDHTDAAIAGLRDAGRRGVLGYFEGIGENAHYPGGAYRVHEQYFSSDDQLLSMVMGGEISLNGYEEAWRIGRDLGIPIATHIVGAFGMQPLFDSIGASGQLADDLILIHMTGMSERGWKYAADSGAHVSLSVPIEMHMRHGNPPIQQCIDLGISMSLSSDVECTMTADFFSQMRSLITLQRMWANEKALASLDYPALMTTSEAVKHATLGGAEGLKLDHKIGSLTPGKEADIILLDAETINVAPLNNATGAIVTLMERSNVDTVIVGGRVRKWKGELLGHDLPKLRQELNTSRDYLFRQAGVEIDLFK